MSKRGVYLSWRCDICDSYNEESSQQCYVCGQARSAESIREGKIYKALSIFRWIFISSLSASYATIVIALIIKTTGGNLDCIWQLTKTVFGRMLHNIHIAFDENIKSIISQCSSIPFVRFSANAKTTWFFVTNNFSYLTWISFTALPNIAYVNIKNSYYNEIILIGRKIYTHISMFSIVVSGLISNVYIYIGKLSGTIKGLFNAISKHFNQ